MVTDIKAEGFFDAVSTPQPMSFSIIPEKRVSIAPDNSYMDDEARVTLKFARIPITPESFIGISIRTEYDFPLQVMLGDGDQLISRYYPKLIAGKNNLLIIWI
ncbi:MAG: hypothetical protein JZU65_24830 [Chlorobium sp.]|nr:hypothetical protein [Chlorobium sp.]